MKAELEFKVYLPGTGQGMETSNWSEELFEWVPGLVEHSLTFPILPFDIVFITHPPFLLGLLQPRGEMMPEGNWIVGVISFA